MVEEMIKWFDESVFSLMSHNAVISVAKHHPIALNKWQKSLCPGNEFWWILMKKRSCSLNSSDPIWWCSGPPNPFQMGMSREKDCLYYTMYTTNFRKFHFHLEVEENNRWFQPFIARMYHIPPSHPISMFKCLLQCFVKPN